MYPSLRFLFCLVLSLALLPRAQAQLIDGAVDPTFVPPNITYGQSNRVVRQPDGKFLVAGDFTLANGTFSSCLARFNADGTLDTAFTANLGTGFDGTVVDLILTSAGKIICLGAYFNINGTPRIQMAQLNSDGTLDTTWNVGALLNATTGALGNGFPNAVLLLPGDKILVVGQFNGIGDALPLTARNNIARFNADGTHDTSFDPGNGLTFTGNSTIPNGGAGLLRFGSQVYVQGAFDAYNGVSCPAGYARISVDGAHDPTFSVASATEPYVVGAGLAFVDSTGRPYVAGSFGTFNGVARRDIARLTLTGSVDPTFNAGTIPGGSGIQGASINAADQIYIAGGFNIINGTPRRSFARLLPTGALDTSFNPGSGATNGYGNVIFEMPDGRVFCGGGFAQFNGSPRGSLAICSSTGVTDATFVTSGGLARGNSFGTATVVQPDGKILVGGFFSYADSAARQSLIRLNADGSLDATFNPGGVGGDNSCRAILLRPDGKMYICGQFRSWNNVPRLRLARLNADGTLDNTFDPGLGLDNIPYALAEQADGKVVVVGAFTTANGVPRNGIARFNSDGTHDLTFNPGTGFTNATSTPYSVFALGLQSTGQIIAGGLFTTYNGTARNGFVRINTDGTIDATFTAAPNTNTVRAIAMLAGDKMYVGGAFNQFNATVRQRIARLNADGSLDATFTAATPNISVRTILPLASGQLYIGGTGQSQSGANLRRQVARLNSDGTLDPTFDVGGAGATYLYGVATPIFAFFGSTVVSGLAVQPGDGALVAAGSFYFYGGQARTSVVRFGKLLDSFLIRNFTPAERLDPLVSGLTADPDGDGFSNLAELAFNLNPRLAAAPPGGTTHALVTQGAFMANQITFPRLMAAPGITYVVEVSSDLQTWTGPTGSSQVGLQQTTDGVTQLVTFRDSTPLGPSVPRRFMRVRITKTP